ncbi:TlpA family protein disulfide reductase [Ginsengibacter hankyongi]|uniref:TlpA family protein disulfide reductase n=1 Tax=Ginsengibacter hankyongi TaxID=2607284 RepID=A0A5J5III1_9BACT|nr:TlpA disulfide reductase family protein [Ginsengibacter hankyongi]KAA9040591.1 TlpA family protein disulfide reductase [Ginsengibacter hankyongi]
MGFINSNKRLIKRVLNILLIAFFIFIIISPNGKAWLLQQFVAVGLFKPEIKKDTAQDLPVSASFAYTDSTRNVNNTANLKGKVVFINFWASWCPPCRAEMPSLHELYKKLQNDTNFIFLFINEDENKTKAIDYLEKNHFSFPVYYTSGDVPAEIFNGSLPTTIVINKKGNVVLNHKGIGGYDSDSFIRQLKEL